MFPLVSEISKDWHSSVPNDLRINLIKKLVMGLIPSLNNGSAPINKEAIGPAVIFAKIEEKNVFELADSRSEYYHKLAERIYKWRLDIESNIPIFDSAQMSQAVVESDDPKAWQSTITNELREHIVNKINGSVKCPWYPEPALDLATKAENICFHAAKTRFEYYNLVAEKIYRMQRALELRKTAVEATHGQSSDLDFSQIQNEETKLQLEAVLSEQAHGDDVTELLENLNIR